MNFLCLCLGRESFKPRFPAVLALYLVVFDYYLECLLFETHPRSQPSYFGGDFEKQRGFVKLSRFGVFVGTFYVSSESQQVSWWKIELEL